MFLTTPPDGLRDLSVAIAYAVPAPPVGRSATLTASWRDLSDADGRDRYGREWNAAARLVLNDHWAAEVKAARFDGDQAAFADRTRMWAALEYRF